MNQRARFVASEGDAYHARNRGREVPARAEHDLVLRALEKLALRPARVLEIGAGDGSRLAALCDGDPALRCTGIDPSAAALANGSRSNPRLAFARATAERLPFRAESFELVILGFCMYLVDREDLFAVAAEVDRVLTRSGHVAVLDFLPDTPHRRAYAHARGLYSYKMDYAHMFLWNPAYQRVACERFTHPGGDPERDDDRLAVSVLAKRSELGWPERA